MAPKTNPRKTKNLNNGGEEDDLEDNPTGGTAEAGSQSLLLNPHGSRQNTQTSLTLDESLKRYIENIVTASLGVSRAEDLRNRRAEYEAEKVSLRQEIVRTIQEELRPPTTGVEREIGGPNNISPPREQSTAHHTPVHNPVLAATAHRENQHDPSQLSDNIRNFEDQLNGLNLNSDAPSGRLPSTLPYRLIEFQKWGLKFDNKKMTVDDFLYRLNRLKICYKVTWEDIFLHFHIFVVGEVEIWFWTFVKSNPGATWRNLEFALIEQFRSIETDSELSRKMFDRRQGPTESFDSFYQEILVLNSRLRLPKSPRELIELIKQNVRRRTGELLITFNTNSLPEMVYFCRAIEKHSNQNDSLRARVFPTANRNPVAKVNELEHSYEDFHDIEAIGFSQRNQINFTCWNCKNKGHSYKQCPSPQRNLFCFRCGMENTTSPKCVKCSENRKRGDTTGESCPSQVNPEVKPSKSNSS